MLNKWLGADVSKEFGVNMAMLLVKAASKEQSKKRIKPLKKEEKRFDSALFSIEKQLNNFISINKLNIYSKAQMGSSFKFTLLENGFESDVANSMTTWLLLRCK
ncbi:hypothetical protein [Comamonas sp. C24C]